ncbi:hypothetical protein MMC21_004229 [Puttea exsequens]|nr:hypothetical protein [Puttea exsequens]
MSYPNQYGGGYGAPPPQGPSQGYPPQGYPPQQGYGQGYPPQQQPPYGQQPHSPYPQQNYPPPQQPPYGQPHSPYPPQQHQGYGAPPSPQPGYGAPPPHQQGYGAPPPHQQGYGGPPPPQQGYGAPPSQQYGAPPPQQYGAPQAPYGAPPQSGGYTAPTPPSPGYVPGQAAPIDMSGPADACRKAMKGMGTNETMLINALVHIPPLEIPTLKQAYHQRHGRNLEHDIEKETTSYFEMCLLSILRGPLQQDVWTLNRALAGAGTNEDMLNEVLIGRSNADLTAIKQAYHHTYHRSLESDVRSDTSMKTERMFMMILAATRQEDSAPIIPASVDADVAEIHRATEARVGAEPLTVCAILTNRSDAWIRAIATVYERKYRRSLEKVIIDEFAGHMEDALMQMVRCGTDRAMRDAANFEKSMAGVGTKDEMLVVRTVKAHWDRRHLEQVKGAYRTRYRADLVARIRGETSGDYEKALVAMLQ